MVASSWASARRETVADSTGVVPVLRSRQVLVKVRPGAFAPAPPGGAKDRLVGRVLGSRYRVLSRLGEGGMGTVYLAERDGAGLIVRTASEKASLWMPFFRFRFTACA